MKLSVKAKSEGAIRHEIERQTDLLAFKDDVATARAGRRDPDFTAALSELRESAERIQTTTKDIGSFSNGTAKPERDVGSMLAKLLPDLQCATELLENIRATCHKRDFGTTQLNQTIQQLDKVAQLLAAISKRAGIS